MKMEIIYDFLFLDTENKTEKKKVNTPNRKSIQQFYAFCMASLSIKMI